VGLNELCRAVLQLDVNHSDVTMDFALKVLTHLKREAQRLSSKHKVRFLLSGESAEVTSHRLARLDIRFFGQIAAGVACGDPGSDAAYYTEGVGLPARSAGSLVDRIRTEGVFHSFGFRNAASQVWVGESAPSVEDFDRLISEAFFGSSCAALIFCPEFTSCSSCGVTSRGRKKQCATCSS